VLTFFEAFNDKQGVTRLSTMAERGLLMRVKEVVVSKYYGLIFPMISVQKHQFSNGGEQ